MLGLRLFPTLSALPVWESASIFRCVCDIAKCDHYLLHVCLSPCPSVHPHGTTRLPLDGYSRNCVSEYCWKIKVKVKVKVSPTTGHRDGPRGSG